ncbi:MAG: AAA family ATPase [Treponema sp.]|nr:AAA family ATPase [Treponema sp.]
MEDLFDAAKPQKEPLAARMRPRNLDEYIGQDHIVGKGRLLRRAIAADQLTSVIFYGPPGSGKTTLARVIANHTKSNFITLNAVLTGVAEIRAAIKQAEEYFKLYTRRTILFVDEVHRWNKAQQDALLPWVENGTIILIGATTENPFFEVNKALVSRSRVFQLKPLTKDDLLKAAHMALSDPERGYGHYVVQFEEGALEHLVDTANGDARSLLNALELAVETTPEKWAPYAAVPEPAWGSTIYISKEAAEESIQKKVVLYDRDGDYHYDIISAFIKSLRGRDPDAAMYWLARMVRAGEDPHFIFRRMLISACEDTGLADPYALGVVTACADAFDRVGLPEGRYHLAHAALYLATAPKSNSSMAFFDALSSVEKEDVEVPNHLRDGNRDAEGFGHGEGYMYPHAYRDHWVAQQYLPDALVGRVFYTPSTQGYEAKIREEVLSRRELQISAILENAVQTPISNQTCGMHPIPHQADDYDNPVGEWWMNKTFGIKASAKGELLTFTPKDDRKESALDRADRSWRSRLDTNRAQVLLSVRNSLITLAELSRHHRSLVWNADDGLLLWEVSRKTPEGQTSGVCRTEQGKQILEQYGRTLDDLDRPILLVRPREGGAEAAQYLTPETFRTMLQQFQYKGTIFDRLFFRDPFVSEDSVTALADAFSAATAEAAKKRGFAFTDEVDREDKAAPAEVAADSALTADEEEELTSSAASPLAPGWKAVIAQRIPAHGQRISALIEKQVLTAETRAAFAETLAKLSSAEEAFFGDSTNPLFSWNCDSIQDTFEKAGFSVQAACQKLTEKRRISESEIMRWFDTKTSAYATYMASAIGEVELGKLSQLLHAAASRTLFDWQTEIAYVAVSSRVN